MIHTTQKWKIGDNIELMREMPRDSIDAIITSPPYWGLRNYQVDGQIGLEPTMEEYHARMLEVTAECMRVLKPTGVMFWNHGDSYPSGGGKATESSFNRSTGIDTGSQPDNRPSAKLRAQKGKCMVLQNERLIIRMIDEQNWILRDRIIWAKKVWFAKTNKTTGNSMPSSVKDRCSFTYEPIYMLTKSQKYWTDMEAIRVPYTEPMNRWGGQKLKADGDSKYTNGVEGGYRKRDMRPDPTGSTSPNVWQINTKPYTSGIKDIDHFAVFPPDLVKRLVLMACPAEICPMCGLARERITEKFDFGVADSDTAYQNGNAKSLSQKRQVYRKAGFESPPAPKTVGWTSCDCGEPFIAGTVLDPFCGSGTVLEVCRKLNRNAIGLELNPDYEKLIKKRSMSYNPPLSAFFGD